MLFSFYLDASVMIPLTTLSLSAAPRRALYLWNFYYLFSGCQDFCHCSLVMQ